MLIEAKALGLSDTAIKLVKMAEKKLLLRCEVEEGKMLGKVTIMAYTMHGQYGLGGLVYINDLFTPEQPLVVRVPLRSTVIRQWLELTGYNDMNEWGFRPSWCTPRQVAASWGSSTTGKPLSPYSDLLMQSYCRMEERIVRELKHPECTRIDVEREWLRTCQTRLHQLIVEYNKVLARAGGLLVMRLE